MGVGEEGQEKEGAENCPHGCCGLVVMHTARNIRPAVSWEVVQRLAPSISTHTHTSGTYLRHVGAGGEPRQEAMGAQAWSVGDNYEITDLGSRVTPGSPGRVKHASSYASAMNY